MDEYTDSELLEMFEDKSSRNFAFNLIVRKYQERVYWHIRRLVISHDDANDVMQNTFIKAWKGLANFRGNSALFTWIYRIATNESLSFLKMRQKRFFVSWEDADQALMDKMDTDPYFEGDEIQRKLHQAVLKLPEKQRLVFNMKYFEDMKYEDISEVLETSVGGLKASYHHAVKKIKEDLKKTD